MAEDPRLLVVDDEEAICEGCRRIFARQGFRVEKSHDALEGLSMAEDRDYAAILLDIKMPTMDGIQFLQRLREKKPTAAVILMTGYPSLPNAMSAVRLGAAGYVTKPFTPEEISQAVHKFIPSAPAPRDAAADSWTPPAAGLSFWNESWYGPLDESSVRVGAAIARSETPKVQSIRLPGIGEVVYQGLPLASVAIEGKPAIVVPAPVSGVVVAVNARLAKEPGLVLSEPCTGGWIAAVCPTRLEEESALCSRRRAILFNTTSAAAEPQRAKLAALGCCVRLVQCWEDLAAALEDSSYRVLILEAQPLGDEGPGLVAQIKAIAPTMKIVVAASRRCTLETAYRARRIFYYAIEPFADNEIVDILDAAFLPQLHPATGPAEWRRRGRGRHLDHQPPRGEGPPDCRAGVVAERRRPGLPDSPQALGPAPAHRDDLRGRENRARRHPRRDGRLRPRCRPLGQGRRAGAGQPRPRREERVCGRLRRSGQQGDQFGRPAQRGKRRPGLRSADDRPVGRAHRSRHGVVLTSLY